MQGRACTDTAVYVAIDDCALVGRSSQARVLRTTLDGRLSLVHYRLCRSVRFCPQAASASKSQDCNSDSVGGRGIKKHRGLKCSCRAARPYTQWMAMLKFLTLTRCRQLTLPYSRDYREAGGNLIRSSASGRPPVGQVPPQIRKSVEAQFYYCFEAQGCPTAGPDQP